jgi:tetratricopeptide (TPR) repeat protein
MSRAWALVFALALASPLAGCSRGHSPEPCGDADAGAPVDATLLAFLSRARAAHHLADQAEAARDLGRAARALQAVTDGPRPPGPGANAPEVREVLADTLARLADLASQLGDPTTAERHLERGLALVPTPTYFRGHLFEVRGLVEERNASQLEQRGEAVEAARAKERALEALETAMKIQAQVIEKRGLIKP